MKSANEIWRELATPGLLTKHKPPKLDIREWGTALENNLGGRAPDAVFAHRAAAGVNGGDFNTGARRIRPLTQIENGRDDVSIASSVISLGVGEWHVRFRSKAYQVDRAVAFLRNITANTDAIVGAPNICGAAVDVMGESVGSGRFTLTSASDFRIEDLCATSKVATGLGKAGNLGAVEEYCLVEVWRVDDVPSSVEQLTGGAESFRYVYDQAAAAGVAAGELSFSDTDPEAATYLYVNEESAAGTNLAAWMAHWEDGSSYVKVSVRVASATQPEERWIIVDAIKVEDLGGYFRLTIDNAIGSDSALIDTEETNLIVSRTGDIGIGPAEQHQYTYDQAAAAAVGTGELSFNNSNPNAATFFYANEITLAGVNIAATMARWGAGTSQTKFVIRVAAAADPEARWVTAEVTKVEDLGAYSRMTIVNVASSGSALVAAEKTFMVVSRVGDAGIGSVEQFKYSYAGVLTGEVSFNNVDPTLATFLYANETTQAGVNIADNFVRWGALTSYVKFTIRVAAAAAPEARWITAEVTKVEDLGTYNRLTIQNVASSGSALVAAEDVIFVVSRTGDLATGIPDLFRYRWEANWAFGVAVGELNFAADNPALATEALIKNEALSGINLASVFASWGQNGVLRVSAVESSGTRFIQANVTGVAPNGGGTAYILDINTVLIPGGPLIDEEDVFVSFFRTGPAGADGNDSTVPGPTGAPGTDGLRFGRFRGLYDNAFTYSLNGVDDLADVVIADDGRFYISIDDGNLNHDPVVSPVWWRLYPDYRRTIPLGATGQSLIGHTLPFAWTPPPNFMILDNDIGDKASVGTAFVAPDPTEINSAIAWGAEIARQNPDAFVPLVIFYATGTNIRAWLEGDGAYGAGTTYAKEDFVTAADGNKYKSKVDANTGNTPPSSPTQWELIGPDAYAPLTANMAAGIALTDRAEFDFFYFNHGPAQDNVSYNSYHLQVLEFFGRLRGETYFRRDTPITSALIGDFENTGDLTPYQANEAIRAIAHNDPAQAVRLYDPNSNPGATYWPGAPDVHQTAEGYWATGKGAAQVTLHGSQIVSRVPAEAINARAAQCLNINGDHIFDQLNEGADVTLTSGGAKLTDGWRGYANGTLTAVARRVAVTDLKGFPYALEVEITGAEAVLAAGSNLFLETAIEGRMLDPVFGGSGENTGMIANSFLAFNDSGSSVKLSYWAGSDAKTIHFFRTFDLLPGVWTPVPIVHRLYHGGVPSDWSFGERNIGMFCGITLAAGATWQRNEDETWALGAQKFTSAAQTNFAAATGRKLRLTGWRNFPGMLTPQGDHIARTRRSAAAEFALCQERFWKSFRPGTAPAQNVGSDLHAVQWHARRAAALANGSHTVWLPEVMKAVPLVTTFNLRALNAQARDLNAPGDCTLTTGAGHPTERSFRIDCTTPAGTAIGNIISVGVTADSWG